MKPSSPFVLSPREVTGERGISKFKAAVLVLAGLLVLGLALEIHAACSQEPVAQGKRLGLWLKDLPFGQPGEKRQRAQEAVQEMGTNALPALLAMLSSKDLPFKLKLIELLSKQSLFKLHFDTAYDRRLLAHYGLEVLGATAKPAFPALTELLNHSDMPGQTADTLARIGGADALPPLTQALTHKDKRVRYGVVLALGRLGTQADKAVPLLLSVLTDKDPGMRMSAALALGEIEKEPAVVVPALIGALGDADSNVRRGAAAGLRGYSDWAEAGAAVPALVRLLEDPNPGVRSYAQGTLSILEPQSAEEPRLQ